MRLGSALLVLLATATFISAEIGFASFRGFTNLELSELCEALSRIEMETKLIPNHSQLSKPTSSNVKVGISMYQVKMIIKF